MPFRLARALGKAPVTGSLAGPLLYFAESIPLHSKAGFAECPRKDTRQRLLRSQIYRRVKFAKCRTRQTLCRVQ